MGPSSLRRSLAPVWPGFAHSEIKEPTHKLVPSYGLLQLSNELMELIALFLRPNTPMHVLEGNSVLSCDREFKKCQAGSVPGAKKHLSELSALPRLARTCSWFRSVAEWVLYQRIQLPSTPNFIGSYNGTCPYSPTPQLACTLCKRPESPAHVRSLEV